MTDKPTGALLYWNPVWRGIDDVHCKKHDKKAVLFKNYKAHTVYVHDEEHAHDVLYQAHKHAHVHCTLVQYII